MKLFNVYLVIGFILTGCATNSSLDVDPNEVQVAGRIVLKEKALPRDVEKDISKAESQQFLTSMIVGVSTAALTGVAFIPLYSYGNGIQGKPYKYHVKLENGKTLGLYNHYTGFELGDCVKVFISEDIEKFPPRMAYGNVECNF